MKRRGRNVTTPPRSWGRLPKPPYGAVRVHGVRAAEVNRDRSIRG